MPPVETSPITSAPIMPPYLPELKGKELTLVLDLDETLVHSSIEEIPNYDLKVQLKVNSSDVTIYVLVRPFTFEFLEKVSEHYEIVIFTASIKSYANPVIDFIDRSRVVTGRLYRSECINYNGNFIKNLSSLGRDLKKVVIVDNSPLSYIFHPNNALPITSWFEDKNDNKLLEILNILQVLSTTDDIPEILKKIKNSCLEISSTSIDAAVDQYNVGRSVLNSPKPGEPAKFEFREN